MRCNKCKKEMKTITEQVGVDEKNEPIIHRFSYCDGCGLKIDLDSRMSDKKKASSLSIIAAILSALLCTSFIGFIIGIIDLVQNDKTKKHGGSWFAVILGGLILFGGFLGLTNPDSKEEENNTAYEVVDSSQEQKDNDTQEQVNSTEEPKTEESKQEDDKKEDSEKEDGIFNVGDIVNMDDLKISYLSAERWYSGNQFIEPKDGYIFYRMEFEFENVSKSDQFINSGDFACYADGYSMDSCYYGDDMIYMDTISPGKKLKGYLYFEIPADVESVELEYETNYWTQNKIIFIVK